MINCRKRIIRCFEDDREGATLILYNDGEASSLINDDKYNLQDYTNIW